MASDRSRPPRPGRRAGPRRRVPVPRRRPIRAAFAAALLLAGLSACSPRDHLNPFDPENDATNGRPEFLSAVAGNGRVDLAWDSPDYRDFESARLLRRRESGEVDTLAAGIDRLRGDFADTSAVNDSTYRYTLEFFFAGDGAPRPTAEVTATPGRRVIWVLDQSAGGPHRVSPDGRARVVSPGLGRPTDMDVRPGTGEVASVDFFDPRIERYAADGTRLRVVEPDGQPLSIAWAGADSSVWVGAYAPTSIRRLAADLSTVLESDTAVGVPEDLAWDPARGALWVADSDRGQLLHRRADGGTTRITGLQLPFSVGVEPATGDGWLIDRAARSLLRISATADTVLFRRSDFNAPFQLLVDPERGGVWVSDNLAGQVTLRDGSGAVQVRLTGFLAPTGLALDPGSGNLWITDAQRDELLLVTPAGEIVTRLRGFDGPFAVQVALPADD